MSRYTVISQKICKKTKCFCYPNEEDGILYVITNDDGEIVVKIDENRIYMFKMVDDYYINIPTGWRLEESHSKKAIVFEKTTTQSDDLCEIIICELRKIINT